MSHKWFLVVAVAVLIVVMGLLSMGGLATLAFRGLDQTGPHFAAPFLCGIGMFFTVGSFLMLLFGVGTFFRFRAWKMAGGPKSEGWARHWHRPHGPMPPWCRGWEEPSEEEAEKAEPETGTGDAETED
jgi:hypothetical protein